ncbi:GCN5-related N-acetyltransferase [Chthoniobacter flavus Ellin428]|uniref:GCN5-related N-acetyltransferase n=1 Tax=Chthoniobacter flavus Ellin428 TaxID=497964 RepID=B4D0B6_9BACT|nr:GNAT family N-acetyltransferase [Chthoniobacter flavus]EDY20430.1 GCN5-related N-acetyltransferase [Chthoniobacter flavus Ellin428]TCO83199.1 acetyltransferase (GNAT) family protein [Chthoniobacter flavus]
MKHLCPVCGWPELNAPPYDEARNGSFEICPCCGVEFGYDDAARGQTLEQTRARWIAGGMKWWSTSRPEPKNWDATRQLARAASANDPASAGPLVAMVGDRCEEIEADFTAERMQGIWDREGNPHGIDIRPFGSARAFLASGLSAMRMFNRVLNFRHDEVIHLEAILAYYSAGGISPEFEIHPHDGCEMVFEHLAAHGFRQTGFHAAFVGVSLSPQAIPGHIVVKPVRTPMEFESFLDAYLRGWKVDPLYLPGARANMEFWQRCPHWRLYLAEMDGVVAGVGIVFLQKGAAYLTNAVVLDEFRRRGIQSALIAARVRDAAAAGCQTIYAHAAWDSANHRNLLRSGLQLCYTKALWGRAG